MTVVQVPTADAPPTRLGERGSGCPVLHCGICRTPRRPNDAAISRRSQRDLRATFGVTARFARLASAQRARSLAAEEQCTRGAGRCLAAATQPRTRAAVTPNSTPSHSSMPKRAVPSTPQKTTHHPVHRPGRFGRRFTNRAPEPQSGAAQLSGRERVGRSSRVATRTFCRTPNGVRPLQPNIVQDVHGASAGRAQSGCGGRAVASVTSSDCAGCRPQTQAFASQTSRTDAAAMCSFGLHARSLVADTPDSSCEPLALDDVAPPPAAPSPRSRRLGARLLELAVTPQQPAR
jgi:hypothetical protein